MPTAILMAAGRGTRISRTINDRCKCTLDIGGTPLIRYTVQTLLSSGFTVQVVVGYDKQRVIEALNGLPVTFYQNNFYSITNSLVSLWFARNALKGDVVLLGNADVYWEPPLLEQLLQDKRDNVMLCDYSRVENGDYLFRVENGRVVACGKGNNCYNANCEYVGLAAIRDGMIEQFRDRLDRMVEEEQCHDFWWEQVLYSMIPEHPIWAEDVNGVFWAEIDYIEDYYRILEYRKQCKKI